MNERNSSRWLMAYYDWYFLPPPKEATSLTSMIIHRLEKSLSTPLEVPIYRVLRIRAEFVQ